jgi:hypothetical protein
MSEGWENHEPAPLEYFHGKLMDAFHELRLKKGDNPEKTLTLGGIEFGNMIDKIKMEVYKKYPKQVSSNAILKSEI